MIGDSLRCPRPVHVNIQPFSGCEERLQGFMNGVSARLAAFQGSVETAVIVAVLSGTYADVFDVAGGVTVGGAAAVTAFQLHWFTCLS